MDSIRIHGVTNRFKEGKLPLLLRLTFSTIFLAELGYLTAWYAPISGERYSTFCGAMLLYSGKPVRNESKSGIVIMLTRITWYAPLRTGFRTYADNILLQMFKIRNISIVWVISSPSHIIVWWLLAFVDMLWPHLLLLYCSVVGELSYWSGIAYFVQFAREYWWVLSCHKSGIFPRIT